MARGEPITAGDFDLYIRSILENDVPMQAYSPGGFWPGDADKDSNRPATIWWQRIPGDNTVVQDGQLSRVQSNPEYVITLMDLQEPENIDRVTGTAGMELRSEPPYYNEGVKRLYTLFHARTHTVNNIEWFSHVRRDYQAERKNGSKLDVMTGWVVQFRAA